MKKRSRQQGFSLLETLLAVSALAIGMVFVAGTFMAGIYFTSLSTERTIAAVASEEALAKIRLYGLDTGDPNLKSDGFVPYDELADIPADEFLYPSFADGATRQYSWTVLCKRMNSSTRLVQVTLFVCRHAGNDARYWVPASDAGAGLEQGALPRPLRVAISQESDLAEDEVTIHDDVASGEVDESTFASEGSMVVDDETGQIYRVLERYREPTDRIRLDRAWNGANISSAEGAQVWVVPRPVEGGRSPLVAVYQKVLGF